MPQNRQTHRLAEGPAVEQEGPGEELPVLPSAGGPDAYDPQRAEEGPQVGRRDLKPRPAGAILPQKRSPELLDLMVRAGFKRVFIGIEPPELPPGVVFRGEYAAESAGL